MVSRVEFRKPQSIVINQRRVNMKRKIPFQALPIAFVGLAAALSSGCQSKSKPVAYSTSPVYFRAAAKRAPDTLPAVSSPVRVPRLQRQTRLSSP